jgi:nucleoside-diphosphate-sugar epimerase
MTRPRVLVCGAGLIGAETARLFGVLGAVVTCADRNPSFAQAAARQAQGTPASVDLGDRAAVRALLSETMPQVVIHAAGERDGGEQDPERAPGHTLLAGAVGAAVTLAAEAVRARVRRIVLVSSLGVYGMAPAGPVAETQPARAVTLYGAAKITAEAALEAATAGTPTTVAVARLAGVYGGTVTGTGGRLNEAFHALLAAHLAGEPVYVNAELGGRECLYVKDAAEALVRLAGSRTRDVYNIGTGTPLRTADIAAAFAALGADASAEPDGQPSWWLDVGKARRQLDFKARASLADGLRDWSARLAPRPGRDPQPRGQGARINA